jgi:threonine/homoserine/homoserine lactone efflux protein
MNMFYLIKGIIIGLAIAAPVGPIGVLCIRRSLVHGRLYGLISGLGAATADAIYGFIAGFGLTVISNFLIDQKFWLEIIGGTFLCYLGIQTLRSKPAENPANVQGESLLKVYTSIFFLTMTNPMTILSFVGICAGLGISNGSDNLRSSILLVLGVFGGSALWWLLLSLGVGFFRNKLNLNSMIWVNRLSGLTVLGFGLVAFYSFLR